MAGSKKKPVKNLSFGEAVTEVEDILAGLEDDNIDIDKLGEEVRRAVELIQVCRGKLEKTDSEVKQLVAGLQTSGSSDDAAASENPDNGDVST